MLASIQTPSEPTAPSSLPEPRAGDDLRPELAITWLLLIRESAARPGHLFLLPQRLRLVRRRRRRRLGGAPGRVWRPGPRRRRLPLLWYLRHPLLGRGGGSWILHRRRRPLLFRG